MSCKAPFMMMKTYDGESLKNLLMWVGFKGKALTKAINIVYHESNGHAFSHNVNPKTGDNSYGLFQINMLGDMGKERKVWFNIASYSDLFDPVTNARAAFKLSSGGKDFSKWPSYDFVPIAY